jgi:hypothetical protein
LKSKLDYALYFSYCWLYPIFPLNPCPLESSNPSVITDFMYVTNLTIISLFRIGFH